MFDFVALILFLAVIALTAATFYSAPRSASEVALKSRAATWIYPLSVDRLIQPLGDPASCLVEIADARVRVARSECPRQICVLSGWISSPGQWIACVPHGILITIAGARGGEADATAY